MKQTIHIIRHAKTTANKAMIFSGTTDVEITEDGKREIEEYKKQGCYPNNIDFCILSNLKRTKQTMDIIYPNAQFIKTPLLNECSFGDFEMRGFDELKKRKDYNDWINDTTDDYTPPKGESRNTFAKRCKKGFDFSIKMAEELGYNEYAIICHGGVISTLLCILCNDKRPHYERVPKNGCGITLSVERTGEEYMCRLIAHIGSTDKNNFNPVL